MDTFSLMAHHNCLRDKASLLTMSSSIERDIKAITQLDVHIKSKNFTDYLPRFIKRKADENIREKRGLGVAAGLILGGSAIANIFSSSYTSSATFSFVGQGLSKLFGTATESDIQNLEHEIITNSKKMNFSN